METLNQTEEKPFSLWYFLSGRERTDNLRLPVTDHRSIVSTGIISLLCGLTNGLLSGINIDKSISYTGISILLGCITFLFLLFFHRTVFIYSDKNGKSKAMVISMYILVYIFLCYVETRVFLYYYLDTEIAALHKGNSPLKLAEGLIATLRTLNTDQQRSVQNFRFLIFSILLMFSLLPLLGHILSVRARSSSMDTQSQLMIQTLQGKLLEKKMEFANLNSVAPDPNDPFAATGSSEAELTAKREQILSEILHLQRAIDTI